MEHNTAELDAMSGTGQQSAQTLKLDEVQLNGKDGSFVIKHRTKEKVKDGDREVYPKTELKGTYKILFLKKRRMLIERGARGVKVRETNEHNLPTDMVTLYNRETNKSEIGVAKELREKYPNLRTHEVIYGQNLVTGEVLKLIIRGSSLHMENEAKGMTLFYDHIKSFTGEDKFYLYETELVPTEVQTDLGTVYAINFVRGRKITDEEFKIAAAHIKSIHASITQSDIVPKQATVPSAVAEPVIDYDETDGTVNVDDIPF